MIACITPRLLSEVLTTYDSLVNVLDAVMLVNEILLPGGFTDAQFAAADLNGDNLLNVLDVVILVNIILEG